MDINKTHTIAILAFNNHQLTIDNIDMLLDYGYTNILLFDNGSSPSFKEYAYNHKLKYHREEKNIYVNPAWNKIFDSVDTKYLTLLNNDCYILSSNYFNDVISHMENNSIILSSCKTYNRNNFNIKKIIFYKKIFNLFYNKKIIFTNKARRQGWLMTLNIHEYKKLNYLIPNYLKIWYGDDWIWSQIIKNNKEYAIYKNRYALHLRNKTLINNDIQSILNQDIHMMKENSEDWVEESIYMKTRLFNRYV